MEGRIVYQISSADQTVLPCLLTASYIAILLRNDPDMQDGTELLPEPNDHPAAKEYQMKVSADGIPATMFGVEDIHKEYQRLLEKSVNFTMKTTKMGENTTAVFDDTCGNLIQIIQK